MTEVFSRMAFSYLAELHQSPKRYYYCSRARKQKKETHVVSGECAGGGGVGGGGVVSLWGAKRSKMKTCGYLYSQRERWMSEDVNRCQSLSKEKQYTARRR